MEQEPLRSLCSPWLNALSAPAHERAPPELAVHPWLSHTRGDEEDRRELSLILKEGEGYKIEFKEGFNNLDKELVAFANSSGGRIFLGVTDEGKIKGIGVTTLKIF